MVAEVLDDENSAHLYTAGVDEVVETNQLGFSLLSHAMTMHGTARVISRFASFGENSLFVGRWANMSEPMTFRSLCDTLRTQHQIMLVGVRTTDGEELINPPDDLIVQVQDTLFYLGQNAVLMEVDPFEHRSLVPLFLG